MLIRRIYDDDLAQASYLVGCQATGEAVVIDPRREPGVYIDEAQRNGMEIVAVTDTHIHADYLSGARELAQATGAALHLSDEGGPDWQYGFEHEGLRDGDEIRVGNIILRAVHTPGHTPEHLSFLVTDSAATELPGYLFTGDFVFVGDLGRPDLLDEAAGGEDTRFPMARQLFRSLKERFLALPDYVQVFPGHGSGSACGKALGALESTTVGYERATSWWAPYVLDGDEEGFVTALLDGQPDAPLYFGRMKRQNRQGPALLGEREQLPSLASDELRAKLVAGAVLLDTRPRAEYVQGAVPRSLHVPAGRSFAGWAAWALDPESSDNEIVLVAASQHQAQDLRRRLAFVGIDRVTGFVTDLGDLPTEPVARLTPHDLEGTEGAFVLDVRSQAEYDAGHIPGAQQLHGGRVLWNLDSLPQDRPIVTHCLSGARSSVVASALRAAGFENVFELEGSYQAWVQAQRERVGA